MKDHTLAHAGNGMKKMIVEFIRKEQGDDPVHRSDELNVREILIETDILSLFGLMLDMEHRLGVIFNLDMLMAAAGRRKDISFGDFFMDILERMGALDRGYGKSGKSHSRDNEPKKNL